MLFTSKKYNVSAPLVLALRAAPDTFTADRLFIEEDPTSLDVQKITKHMKSGSKRKTGEFVQRHATWPEQLLDPGAPGF